MYGIYCVSRAATGLKGAAVRTRPSVRSRNIGDPLTRRDLRVACAAVKIAAYEPTTDLSDDTLMAAARAAGRIMYASGTIILPGAKETDIRSPELLDPPVPAMPISENCSLKTHVVTPTVSPIGKRPLFTMDMFTPYVEKGLEAWKKILMFVMLNMLTLTHGALTPVGKR